MANFPGNFYKPEPDPGPDLDLENMDPHVLATCEKPDSMFLLNAKPS